MESDSKIVIHGDAIDFDIDGTLTSMLQISLSNPAFADLPAAISAVDGREITYSKLASQVKILIRRLSKVHQSAPGTAASPAFVAVCLERSFDLLVACCACILGGFTYAAIHPTDPALRKSKILHQLHPVAVVTSSTLLNDITNSLKSTNLSSPIVCLDSLQAEDEESDLPHPGFLSPSPDSIVYCTFTSGSTGTPKGILLSQRSLRFFSLSLRQWETIQRSGSSSPFGSGERVLQISRSSFDIHFFELVGPLLFGGATVLLPPDESTALSSFKLLETIQKYHVTWSFMVPAVAAQLRKALSESDPSLELSLKTLFIGGEAPPSSLFQSLSPRIPFIYNGYGPAECTIFSTIFASPRPFPESLRSISIPIGRPLPGYQAVLVPTETDGLYSLHIGGPGLMTRYLGSETDPTAALVAFTHKDGSSTVLYNSGDLVRLNATGDLIFAGRADDQVKIRGQRIELGDIEAALRDVSSVGRNAAAKVARTANGTYVVVGYLEEKFDEKRVREQCQARLPPWMVPTFFEYLPSGIPMNQNHKVDRKALPPPVSIQEADVAIIGGGVASMITAIACKQRGMSFRIFEAHSELGGVWVNGAANQLSKLQQPFEYYMLDQETSPPCDPNGHPIRFPDTPSLVDYIRRVDSNHSISPFTFFNHTVREVLSVGNASNPATMLTVFDHSSNVEQKLVFGSVICATGRFQPNRSIYPSWIPPNHSSNHTEIVEARYFSSRHARGRRVVIVGGGPYAVEALRLAVDNGASQVLVVNRSPRWVFPRSWFNNPTLTRLFWRLFGGLSLPRRLVLLAKIALVRHYIAAGIENMIPNGLPLTNPQTAISDEWFDYASLPHVKFILGEVLSVKDQTLNLSNGAQVDADSIVIACGFQAPEYPFLKQYSPLKMFLGSTLHQAPNIGFVGVNLGEGVFSNPQTCRIQANMVLNAFQYPDSRRSREYQERWIESMPMPANKDPQGSNTHLAELLSELKYQTMQRCHHSKLEQPRQEQGESTTLSVVTSIADSVLGEHVPAAVPLLHLGMDSIRAIEFRGRLLERFGPRGGIKLPSVSTLLWDLPTVNAIVDFISSQLHEQSRTRFDEISEYDEDEDLEPKEHLLNPEEAIRYIETQLNIPEPLVWLRRDPVDFIDHVCRRFVQIVPFQSFSILVTERCNRFLPNFAEIKRDVFSRIGGCCYTLNVFMLELLRALGLSVYYARCNIHGVEDCHVTVMIRNLIDSGDLWMVDVGCGYVFTRPVCLSFKGPESPVYQHGFLKMRFVRDLLPAEASEMTLWRLHADESTFEAHERTLNRSDGFNHVFWKMSLRPRPLHDRGEKEQYRAFCSFHKLRSAIGDNNNCRMIYYKADNSNGHLDARVLTEENGLLVGTRLTARQLLERLIHHFPKFSIRCLAYSIDRLGCSYDGNGSPLTEKLVDVVDSAPFSSIRLKSGLSTLYTGTKAETLMSKLLQRAERWRPAVEASIASDAARSEQDALFGSNFTERDVVLIAYPNHLRDKPRRPLQVLSNWCSQYFADLFSTVHVLPFHPSTAYDGYSVTDYMAVDPDNGDWEDLENFGKCFKLMFDLVLNHCSVDHPWFKNFLKSQDPGKSYFISQWTPENSEWIKGTVKRARNLPLLYSHQVISTPGRSETEEKFVWCTYHKNMPDLNWDEPEMLLEWVDILLDSVSRGCRAVRLDAFAYTIKRFGTNCVNLPECKVLMQMLQDCLIAAGSKGRVAVLPSITNVSQHENFDYALHGASLVYHLPLSALVLHTLYTGNASVLSRWCSALPPAPLGGALLNLTSSHDGVGLTWCADILSSEQISHLIEQAKRRGGIIQYRRSTESSIEAKPWEINITYYSACAELDSRPSEADRIHIDRLLATQSIPLALQGVPAIYFSLLVGGENDKATVNAILEAAKTGQVDPDAVCLERAINRERYTLDWWREDIAKQEFPKRFYLLQRLRHILKVRQTHAAFHPDALQTVLSLSDVLPSSLFILKRSPLRLPLYDGNAKYPQEVICITNFGSSQVEIAPLVAINCIGGAFSERPIQPHQSSNTVKRSSIFVRNLLDIDEAQLLDPNSLLSGNESLIDLRQGLCLQPYQIAWLTTVDQEPDEKARDDGIARSLTCLNRIARAPMLEFSKISKSKLIGAISWCPLSESPATTMGIQTQHSRFKAFPLDSEQGRHLLSSSPTARVVHMIRHGETFHKRWAAQSTSPDRCYDSTLPDKQSQLIQMQNQNNLNDCPYLDPCCFDPTLTAAARSSCHRVPFDVDTVLAAASHRTLETAELCFSNPKINMTRFEAREELRAMISPHFHSRRSDISVLKSLFPKFEFNSVLNDEDKAWVDCMAQMKEPRHEPRTSVESRISSLLTRICNPDAPFGKKVALVAHFTTFWLMQAPGSDGRIFGLRESPQDNQPLIDFSAFGAESQNFAMFDLGQTVSLVLDVANTSQ